MNDVIEVEEINIRPKKNVVPQACRMEGYDPLDKQTPIYTKLGFTLEDTVSIFLDHKYMSRRLVAEKYGMQNIYPQRSQYLNVAQRLYAYVIDHPDTFEDYLDKDEIYDIQNQVSNRSLATTEVGDFGTPKSVRAVVSQPIDNFSKKVQRAAEKLLNVVDIKINDFKTKKDVKDQDILKLITAFEKLNNMARLVAGEATEHIGVVIKEQGMDKMSNAELITQLNMSRQSTVENKMNK